MPCPFGGSSQMLFLDGNLAQRGQHELVLFLLIFGVTDDPLAGYRDGLGVSGAILCPDTLSLANGDCRSTGNVDRRRLQAG